jgi:hypothetical protein
MKFQETKSAVVHNRTKDLTADIHEHDASSFVGVCKISLFWDRNALALVPSIVVSGAIKELANIAVNPHSHFLSEGLVCFWRNAIEPRSLARLELVDGLVNFTERDQVINFHQLLLLGDQVKDAEVGWSMVTEHMFEVRAKDSHVLTTVGCQGSIGKLHCHVD